MIGHPEVIKLLTQLIAQGTHVEKCQEIISSFETLAEEPPKQDLLDVYRKLKTSNLLPPCVAFFLIDLHVGTCDEHTEISEEKEFEYSESAEDLRLRLIETIQDFFLVSPIPKNELRLTLERLLEGFDESKGEEWNLVYAPRPFECAWKVSKKEKIYELRNHDETEMANLLEDNEKMYAEQKKEGGNLLFPEIANQLKPFFDRVNNNLENKQ